MEAELTFLDFDLPFHLCTDASDVQLGAMLVQEGQPLGDLPSCLSRQDVGHEGLHLQGMNFLKWTMK